MFELEQAIVRWRQQMLAGGIKTPELLAELESHLRDEIERQTGAGVSDAAAFDLAARKLGQPESLRAEFKKTSSLYEFLSKRRTLTFDVSLTRLVGLLWLASSAPAFFEIGNNMFAHRHFDPRTSFTFLVFLGGVVGGMLLLADSRWGRTIVRVNALFWSILPAVLCILFNCFADIDDRNSHVSFWEIITSPGGVFFALGLVSILILHLPEKANLKTTIRI